MVLGRSAIPGRLCLPILACGLAACFEPPVRETMEILFHRGGFDVSVVIRISDPPGDDANPAAARRLEAVREETIRGDDPWARAIRGLDPEVERVGYEFRSGRLAEAVRRARVEAPEALPRLFEAIPVSASLTREEDVLTLEIRPTGASRASGREEREVRERLDAFSAAVADYVGATAALYRYLDTSPERARACFAAVFTDGAGESDDEDGDLVGQEAELVDAFTDAMGKVLKVLVVSGGEAYTLDELSRLVYDPFPASVEIEIAGTIEEIEGFEPRGARRVMIPSLGLWSALEALRDDWVSPSLVLVYVEWQRREVNEKFNLEAFLAEPRVVRATPDASQVRSAVKGRLKSADLYRLRWRLPAAGPEDQGGPPRAEGRGASGHSIQASSAWIVPTGPS